MYSVIVSSTEQIIDNIIMNQILERILFNSSTGFEGGQTLGKSQDKSVRLRLSSLTQHFLLTALSTFFVSNKIQGFSNFQETKPYSANYLATRRQQVDSTFLLPALNICVGGYLRLIIKEKTNLGKAQLCRAPQTRQSMYTQFY